MNLFELFVKIGAKDEASGTISKITSGLGKGLATAAKIGTAAVGAAATGIAALTKASVENYAEYEQLVGGVQTLFGLQGQSLEEYAATVGKTTDEALDEWLKYTTGERKVLNAAEEAYKTAGMSANEYMSTVTSFSASLIQSLGGDTAKAADYASMAITDMADNANKMGTDIEMIKTAYAGFAKQNYTMLDNLKLGYGGTKSEMERLLQDADALSDSFNLQKDASGNLVYSYADIVDAIHIVQGEMGIAGATALEAGTTIEGSVNSMKAAWSNLVTGFADGNADIETLIENLVTTIVGDGTENNLGVIGNVLPAVETALVGIGTMIEKAVPVLVEMLPGLLEQILPVLLSSATSLVNSVVAVLPELVDLIVDTLIDNAPMLIVAAVELILALAGGLIEAVPKLLKAIPTIIKETVDGFKNSENIKKFIDVGKNIVEGIKSGIKNAWNNLVSWFKGLFGDLIGIAKKILGIASPSKVFKKIGGFTAEGFGAGFEDKFAHVKDDMEDSLNFDDTSIGINASIRKVGAGAAGMAYGGTSIGKININIDGAKYSDEQSLASAIALEIQNMTDRRAAVYA